ncbi:MAG: hemolysin family protein [Clostridia bacterium]|nr:hemolysin family protein [Clostridia bacterium]
MSDDANGRSNQLKKNNQSEKKQSVFSKIFKIRQKEVTEEEIIETANDARLTGAIDDNTSRLIERVIDFADTDAGDIMTHRIEMTAIEDTGTINELVELAIESGRSRIPVYHEDIDSIVGAVHVKDLLRYIGKDSPDDVKITDIMRPVLFVPSSKVCSELFSEMTSKKTQIAIVVDEYGGTEGLITMEDMLEEIVGNIQDEYDDEEENVVQISDNIFNVDGATDIEEIEELVGREIPHGDCETVAGLMLDVLGGFPEGDDHPCVRVGELKLTADEFEDRRITKITIEIEKQEQNV